MPSYVFRYGYGFNNGSEFVVASWVTELDAVWVDELANEWTNG